MEVPDGNSIQVTSCCMGLEWLLNGIILRANFLLLPLGSNDMVLGVQWLCTLCGEKGDILFNLRALTMKFEYEGKVQTLQGWNPS